MFDPYLDAPSDGEQDSSSEDEKKGHSPQLFTPPQDKDTVMSRWDDNDRDKNDPTPMHMRIMVIKGMFLTLTLTQWLTTNSC